MRCPQCRQEIDARHQFCPSCGKQLVQTQRGVVQSTGSTSLDDMTGIGWRPSPTQFSQQPVAEAGKSGRTSNSKSTAYRPSENALAPGTLQGIVRNFQQRTETNASQHQLTVWTFRLERYDQRGNPLPPIPVQMRARRFEGGLNDGDTVKLGGSWRAGQTIEAKKVYNVSTASTVTAHATVKMHPVARGCSIAFMTVFIIAFIAVFLFIRSLPGFPGIPGIASPDQTMSDFCKNLQADAYTQAYADYSSNLQKQVSFQQFTQTWTNGSQYYHFDNCAAQGTTTNGNSATTTLNTHEFYSGKTQSYTVMLIEEGGVWKIQTIQAQ